MVMLEYLLAFLGSFFAAILFNIKRSNLLCAGFSGMVGWVVYSALFYYGGGIIIPTFFGAVAVGFYSEIMARKKRVPATVFSIAGIFPIVPGISAYNAIENIVNNKLAEAGAKAVETMTSAGALAFGIMMMTAVFRLASKARKNV